MSGRRRRSAVRVRPELTGEGPVRTCVGCGERDRAARLVRFQSSDSGALVRAVAGRGGRGAYVHARAGCIDSLSSTKLLRRSLRADVVQEARAEFARDLAAVRDGRGAQADAGARD